MKDEEFSNCFKDYKLTAFRLQTLSEYLVKQENREFPDYLRGEFKPNHEETDWIKSIKKNSEEDKKIIQLIVLHTPITPYMHYSFDWWWEDQAKAGASIRCILPEKIEKMKKDLQQDFWLFDDEKLVIMHYDWEGHFLKTELEGNEKQIQKYREIKERTLKESVDLKEALSLIRRGIIK